jgi:hypothetical protein
MDEGSMPAMEVRNFTTETGRDVIADFLDDLSAREAAKCIAEGATQGH